MEEERGRKIDEMAMVKSTQSPIPHPNPQSPSGGDGDRWQWYSVEARGRKIDEMRERESYAPERVSDEMRKKRGR